MSVISTHGRGACVTAWFSMCSGSGVWCLTAHGSSLAVYLSPLTSPQSSRSWCCRLGLQLQSCTGKCLLVKVLLCFHVV